MASIRGGSARGGGVATDDGDGILHTYKSVPQYIAPNLYFSAARVRFSLSL